MTFFDLTVGARARVAKSAAGSLVARRLAEMGLVEGTEFTVVKVAPLGDPIEIELRGCRLCLRRKDAGGIQVECID